MNLRKTINETRSASTESIDNILSAITRFFVEDDRVVKPGESWKFTQEMEKLITEKFGNPEWLSKQTFIEGDLNGDKFTVHLTKSGHVPGNIVSAVQHDIKSILNYAKQFQPKLLSYIREVETVFDRFRDNTNEHNAGEKRKDIKKAVEEIDTQAFRKIDPPVNGLLGDPAFDPNRKADAMYTYASHPTTTIKALDEKGVKQVAAIILEIIQALGKIEELNSSYWSSGIQEDDHFLGNICFEWGDDKTLFNLVCNDSILDSNDRVSGLEKHLLHVAHDLNRWMAASIK